jgi:hypothetical protein
MKLQVIQAIAAGMCLTGASTLPALAQSSTTYAASNMWGTVSSGVAVPGAVDSAAAHNLNGVTAGQVNAAKLGLLVNSGGNTTIESIGSQTIVSSTVYGSNNTTSIGATQSSSNSGSVSTNGTIARNANNN